MPSYSLAHIFKFQFFVSLLILIKDMRFKINLTNQNILEPNGPLWVEPIGATLSPRAYFGCGTVDLLPNLLYKSLVNHVLPE